MADGAGGEQGGQGADEQGDDDEVDDGELTGAVRIAGVQEQQDDAEHRDAAGQPPREQQARAHAERQLPGRWVRGESDGRDTTRGAGDQQIGDTGRGHAAEQDGDRSAQPDARVGNASGDGPDENRADEPDQPGDEGGVHRQAERVPRLLARRLPPGHEPAVGRPLAPQPDDRADGERHGEVAGRGQEDGRPTGVAAVLDAEQQEDDDDADEVGDDDQADDRRDRAPSAERPGREDAVPADRLGPALRLHAQCNDDRRTAATAALRIVITRS